jgi:hypothetical protein
MISDFFKYLADRKCKENDLSDITWALCSACYSFRRVFINYFFPQLSVNDIDDFSRERVDCNERNSRVDLFIKVRNDAVPYLIEIKIGDRNQHFGQYGCAYKVDSTHLGYITNYKLVEEGYEIKAWENFHDVLLKETNCEKDIVSQQLMLGYACYLKKICNIIKFKENMKLKGLYSLYELIAILTKLVSRSEPDFNLEFYSGKNGNRNGIQGIYFKIEYKNDIKIEPAWGWIGIYYLEVDPLICMYFTNKVDWGKPIYDIIDKGTKHDGDYACAPYLEDGAYWFELSGEKHDEFESANLSEQENILKCYMDEVIRYPIQEI